MAKVPQSKTTRTRRGGKRGDPPKPLPEGIAIIGLKEGGVGWTLKGKDRKLSFGRVFTPEDPKAAEKLLLSLKVLDRALLAADAGNVRDGGRGKRATGPTITHLDMAGKGSVKRPGRSSGQAAGEAE